MNTPLLKDFAWWLSRNAALLKRPNGKFLRTQEKRMQKKLQAILNKQLNWVLDALKGWKGLNSIEKNTLNDEVDGLLSGMPGKESLVEAVLFYTKLTMDKGGKTSVKTLGLKEFGISFTLKHPDAVKYLKDKETLELSNYKGNITFTTKSKIKEIIADGILKGKSYTEIAQDISAQGQAGVFSSARAELIAVRESAYAYEFGKKVPMDEFVAKNPERTVVKYWQTVGDSQVTPECEENEAASPIGYNEAFPNDGNQQTAPRDGNPRCRCATSYEIV